jgi:probable HAF family extracellular repeat protein
MWQGRFQTSRARDRIRARGRPRVRLVVLVLALAAGVSTAITHSPLQAGKPPAPVVTYTIATTPLTNVTGMNSFGDMVDGGTNLYDHATGDPLDLAGPVNRLLATPDEGLAYVADINDAWQITGGIIDSNWVVHAFRCSLRYGGTGALEAGALERLPQPAGYSWCLPAAINSRGDVAGQVQNQDVQPQEDRAVIWPAAGGVIQLTTVFSAATDVSDPDVNGAVKVTGTMYRSPEQRAFLYDSASGKTTPLGVLSRRTQSFGYSVNSRGQVAGKSNGGGRTEHSFRYTPGVGMVDLGTIGGYDFGNDASAINAAGHVVGTAVTRINNPYSITGFLYTDTTKMLDLAPLITNPPASLKYFEPKVMNNYLGHDFGQIAGTAYVNEQPAVVLLTPNP